MKLKKEILWSVVTLLFTCFPPTLTAQDMREVSSEAAEARAALMEKAALEKKQAEQAAAKSRALILQDRTKLEKAIADFQKRKTLLEQEISGLNKEKVKLTEEERLVTEELAQTDQMINELIGVIRMNAKDIESLLTENHQMALGDKLPDFLSELTDENSFPGMDSVIVLADAVFGQIERTGEVTRTMGSIIDRDGKTVEAEILVLGPFTAAYWLDGEVGFLRYSSAGRNLYALSTLPPGRMQKKLQRYMAGETLSVPMDIGRGAALQQLSHHLSLWEQVEKGGVIVWPILAIFIIGLLIVIERVLFILRKRLDSDQFMRKLSGAAQQSNWQECESFCNSYLKKPVVRVIKAGLQCRELEREEMENVLQEAILKEIPPMERFLSTLGMLAAIAPLLGLLGTVTGMIDTFHIITLHGTGDPRLMSGGISEALVTTMLGLGVAIPLMLAQTLLNRSVEKEIGTMEEKGVALVNIIHKNRVSACSA